MSLDVSGFEDFGVGKEVVVRVGDKHPLLLLCSALPWSDMLALVLPDLKRTERLCWWRGRPLRIRIHLGVYLLQQLLNCSDRSMERSLRDNAAFQVFCGYGQIPGWHAPDHSKIEAFRSRLSPATQCALANVLAKQAVRRGFAQAEHIDMDSTVQSPDMSYPASAHLLVKTALWGRRLQKLLQKKLPELVKDVLPIVDMKKIKGIAKEHYFEKHKAFKERRAARQETLGKLWSAVSEVSQPIIGFARYLTEPFMLASLSRRESSLVRQFVEKAPVLLSDIFARCYEDLPMQSKFFAYNRDAVSCFNKNKHYKGLEFGRQFQIGRIAGNFVYSIPNHSIRMPDASSVKDMLVEHIELFQTPIASISADKGYYSKENERLALAFGIKAVGIQRPNRTLRDAPYNPMSKEQEELLANRRAGIEPIIGHLKRFWQMGRSRMKTDQTTESSGYCALLGFNLRQMMRYLVIEDKSMPAGNYPQAS